MTSTPTELDTRTLEVPGAVLTYDVRPGPDGAPVLLLVGSPMGAEGFGTLAGYFTDRTVVTYDVRGAGRSRRTDGAPTNTPEEHAGDLSALIDAVGGPVDLFATSGGAVNALTLVARRPEQVRTLVAHEPPSVRYLPDAEEASAATHAVAEAYRQGGRGPGMAAFIRLVGHRGPVTADLAGPAPDPAVFGLPTEDDGSRDDPLLAQNMLLSTHAEFDLAALQAASTRVVVAVGEGSEGQLARRGGEGVAAALGTAPVLFPGDHGGFLGGEFGQAGKPEAFAARLREVLDGTAD
ncbi:pimeloyl-ACP methyl ester carboxylesterase [Geodermatophilus normandii]|uniref:Pimeloyl-ACP methyl ester carboxylesterase n=1 Tax=Geodermatophilus normandii TaxID=1137989 RepID=A0A317QQB8_9ACTN|nr:alpha/beta hydrolase [Geodermatophilus normandii]PWW24365.1 pimeloyl-ACP methyl ester carboxylesterase [Geodermatophilus normandii]